MDSGSADSQKGFPEKVPTKNRPKVLFNTTDVPQKGLSLLSEKCDLIMCSNNHSRKEILEKARGVDAIFWKFHYNQLDKEIIDAAGPNLRGVATMSSGYNHIDVEELKRRNVPLGRVSDVLSNAVADMAILLALAASRRLHEGRLRMQEGRWSKQKTSMLGPDLQGSTVGIFGFGGIGQAIAKRIKGFEVANIIYISRKKKPKIPNIDAKFVELDQLLKESDFIFIAACLNEETRGICNEEFFRKMKPTAVFVNVSRGDVVDQEALIRALKSGGIFAAGLDAMIPEPLPKDHELLSLPNCVLTPHVGAATRKTFEDMSYVTAVNILLGLEGKPLRSPVF